MRMTKSEKTRNPMTTMIHTDLLNRFSALPPAQHIIAETRLLQIVQLMEDASKKPQSPKQAPVSAIDGRYDQPSKALTEMLRAKAEKGDKEARCQLYLLALRRASTHPLDLTDGVQHLYVAAADGYPHAQYLMGEMFREQPTESLRWHMLALEQGFEPALEPLHKLLKESWDEIQHDQLKSDALRVAQQATGIHEDTHAGIDESKGNESKGNNAFRAQARMLLGQLYNSPSTPLHDENQGRHWLEQAAALDHIQAMHQLAHSYRWGNGSFSAKVNLPMAFYWLARLVMAGAMDRSEELLKLQKAIGLEAAQEVFKRLADERSPV